MADWEKFNGLAIKLGQNWNVFANRFSSGEINFDGMGVGVDVGVGVGVGVGDGVSGSFGTGDDRSRFGDIFVIFWNKIQETDQYESDSVS